MQFDQTETFKNLARSFAGESQAGMRYQLIAKLAMQENLKSLSDAIKTIAKNETFHASRFFNLLEEKGGTKANIDLNAGYPFRIGSLQDGLKFAADDEQSEFTRFIRVRRYGRTRRLSRRCRDFPHDRRSGKAPRNDFRIPLRSRQKRYAL